MPKTCLLAFALMFIASVGHCQKSKIPALEKQIAELDKQIADLKAQGAEGNFVELFQRYEVLQVLSPNTAIVSLRWKDARVTSWPSESNINEDFYATFDTSGLIDDRVYLLNLEPNGETKTYKTFTSSRTIREAVASDKEKIELERKLYSLKATAAKLSYAKTIEEAKAKQFYVYTMLNKKKAKLFKPKLTLEGVTAKGLLFDFDVPPEAERKLAKDELRDSHFRSLTWVLKDKDGEKMELNGKDERGYFKVDYQLGDYHKSTQRTFEGHIDNLAEVFKKYGLPPLNEKSEKRVEYLLKLKAR